MRQAYVLSWIFVVPRVVSISVRRPLFASNSRAVDDAVAVGLPADLAVGVHRVEGLERYGVGAIRRVRQARAVASGVVVGPHRQPRRVSDGRRTSVGVVGVAMHIVLDMAAGADIDGGRLQPRIADLYASVSLKFGCAKARAGARVVAARAQRADGVGGIVAPLGHPVRVDLLRLPAQLVVAVGRGAFRVDLRAQLAQGGVREGHRPEVGIDDAVAGARHIVS